MESSITIYKIDNQWEFSVWLGKQTAALYPPKRGGVGREMRGRFKREGTYVYLWLIHAEV